VDDAALLDLQQLRLQWFDHVFRKAALPPPLQDRVNYEVMGANQWRHAPSLEAMADGTLKYYLAPAESGPRHRLAQAGPPPEGFIGQTLHFTDRRDADWTPPSRLLGRNPEVRNGLSFLSEPLPPATELDGVLSGTLDLRLNRMDLDLRLSLYEQLPNGDCLLLAEPYQFRASYAADRIHRRLLKGGERQQLAFRSDRLISRRLQAGSRVLLVLEVNKRPDQQINYGGGDEVSAESMADAGRKPLRIRWYGGSFVELPVRKQP
jgi:predicted acyl esterase